MKTIQTSARKGNLDQKLQNICDFQGSDLYVGIDIHKQRWQVAVIYDGILLSNTNIEGSAAALVSHLYKFYPGAYFHCVYESGPFGFSLCRTLLAEGMSCIIVNPADIPDTNREQRNKTDPVDARKLARHLAAGLLQGIHVPSEKLQKQRSLIRFRKKLWSDLVRCKNRLKGELLFQGITIPGQIRQSTLEQKLFNVDRKSGFKGSIHEGHIAVHARRSKDAATVVVENRAQVKRNDAK